MSERTTPQPSDRLNRSGRLRDAEPPAPGAAILSWQEGRRRITLPKLVARCMSFSAAACFDDALIAAVHHFYGVDVDVATAETDILEDDFERVRFFPWFLWDFQLPDTLTTIGQRFRAEAELTPFEAELVDALCASSITLVAIEQVDPTRGHLIIRDLRDDTLLGITDATLAQSVVPGHLALVRLIRLGTDGLIDAFYALLPGDARAFVDEELDRLLTREPDTLATLKARGSELFEFAEHTLELLIAPPAFTTATGATLILCRGFIRGDAALALERAIPTCVHTRPSAHHPDVIQFLHPSSGLTARLIAQRTPALAFALEASTPAAFEAARDFLVTIGVTFPYFRAQEEFTVAVQRWLTQGDSGMWLTDPEIAAAFKTGLDLWLTTWGETPQPLLGARSPRAASDPASAPALALLTQRLIQVVGARAYDLLPWLPELPSAPTAAETTATF